MTYTTCRQLGNILGHNDGDHSTTEDGGGELHLDRLNGFLGIFRCVECEFEVVTGNEELAYG